MPLVISKKGPSGGKDNNIYFRSLDNWTKVFKERIIHDDEEKMEFLVGTKKINLIARMPLDPIRLSN